MLFKPYFENSCNHLWESAVTADRKVRFEYNPEFFNTTGLGAYAELFTSYSEVVRNIIFNLVLKFERFSDKQNVIQYIQETIQAAQTDFEYYKRSMEVRFGAEYTNSKCKIIINNTLDYLSSVEIDRTHLRVREQLPAFK